MQSAFEATKVSEGPAAKPRSDGAFVFHHPPKFTWEYDADENQQRRKWSDYHFYVHVPFCRKICKFCTFERRQLHHGALEWFEGLLERQMDVALGRDDFATAKIESTYLGGGTASLLSAKAIRRILGRLQDSFGLNLRAAEVTLECEPGTKRLEDLAIIREGGVNRISIGAQSFDDEQLRLLNRSHDSSQTLEMIANAKRAGFENIHVDLMFGLPGQGMKQWQDAVQQTIDLGIQHISAYPLIVFQGELLARSLRKNELPSRPDDAVTQKMREYAVTEFSNAGFQRYSTSEFALPDYECRYVRSTWDSSNYLGMGPGAYSRNGASLWEDDVIHPLYQEKLEKGLWPVGKSTTMTPEQQLARDIGMGLCLLEVDVNSLQKKSGASFNDLFSGTVRELEEMGLVLMNGSRLRLTELGIRHATYVMKCFCN